MSIFLYKLSYWLTDSRHVWDISSYKINQTQKAFDFTRISGFSCFCNCFNFICCWSNSMTAQDMTHKLNFWAAQFDTWLYSRSTRFSLNILRPDVNGHHVLQMSSHEL